MRKKCQLSCVHKPFGYSTGNAAINTRISKSNHGKCFPAPKTNLISHDNKQFTNQCSFSIALVK